LPTLACGNCGAVWGTAGEAYPAADVTKLVDLAEFRSSRPVDLQELDRLRQILRRVTENGAPLNPGAGVGPFTGVARGETWDFVWHESWTMFLTYDALLALDKHGVRLPRFGKARVSFPVGRTTSELWEPEAIPTVPLARAGLRKPDRQPCSACGRIEGGFATFLIDPEVTIPVNVDLFRASNCQTLYLATQRFIDAAKELDLKGYQVRALGFPPSATSVGSH
jgi:uncharacterized double-CXXCG motif protein